MTVVALEPVSILAFIGTNFSSLESKRCKNIFREKATGARISPSELDVDSG